MVLKKVTVFCQKISKACGIATQIYPTRRGDSVTATVTAIRSQMSFRIVLSHSCSTTTITRYILNYDNSDLKIDRNGNSGNIGFIYCTDFDSH